MYSAMADGGPLLGRKSAMMQVSGAASVMVGVTWKAQTGVGVKTCTRAMFDISKMIRKLNLFNSL